MLASRHTLKGERMKPEQFHNLKNYFIIKTDKGYKVVKDGLSIDLNTAEQLYRYFKYLCFE